MQNLTIFYDARCGLCGQFRRWMMAQESAVRLEFMDYASEEARRRLPELEALDADRQIVVMNESGEIWQGASAWVTCLWALPEWRGWAKRLGSPALLPLAGKACRLISQNRLAMSRLLSLRGDEELAAACSREAEDCGEGTCQTEVESGAGPSKPGD